MCVPSGVACHHKEASTFLCMQVEVSLFTRPMFENGGWECLQGGEFSIIMIV